MKNDQKSRRIRLRKSAAEKKSQNRLKAIQQLSQLLKPYRAHMVIGLLLSFLPAYFTVWIPYLIGRLIDEGLSLRDWTSTSHLGLLILFCYVMIGLANAFVTFCLSWFGLEILVDYRSSLLQRILHYPIRFFDKTNSGRLTTRLTSDINSLQELFSSALIPIFGNSFLILGVMASMLWMNWRLALACLVTPLLIWLTAVFNERIRRRFGFVRQTISSMNSFAGETFSGIRDLQVFNAVHANQSDFDRLSVKLQSRNLAAVKEYGIYNPIVPFLTSLMDIIILGLGSYFVTRHQMSVGQVVAFLAYAANFGWPIRDFSEKFTVLQQALAAVDRLVEVSSHEPEPDIGKNIFPAIKKIEFQDVSFTYASSKEAAVKNLNFSALQGEKIALLGETGSGKTTTCALLMRFYEPSSGQILINSEPFTSFSLDSFRDRLGWVSQDVVLFSNSLRENIRFFDTQISDSEIWQTLELVQLAPWVRSLKDGLETKLTERGGSLSSGQRQLISIARALVRKPALLIFDEATSYIDSATEFTIQEALERIWQDSSFRHTTGFFIAHRLSTLKRCDRMLVFRKGSIIESGTYDELMKKQGYAHSLFLEEFRSETALLSMV